MAYINGKDGMYAPTWCVATQDDIRRLIERTDTTFIVPKGITKLGKYSLAWHGALQELIIPEGLTELDEYALDGCSLATLRLPRTIKKIGLRAFNYSSLQICEIPTDNLESVGQYAFNACKKLKVVRFLANSQNRVPTIHGYTFYTNYTAFDIYVPWGEGEVAGAPWGCALATVHYNSVG